MYLIVLYGTFPLSVRLKYVTIFVTGKCLLVYELELHSCGPLIVVVPLEALHTQYNMQAFSIPSIVLKDFTKSFSIFKDQLNFTLN